MKQRLQWMLTTWILFIDLPSAHQLWSGLPRRRPLPKRLRLLRLRLLRLFRSLRLHRVFQRLHRRSRVWRWNRWKSYDRLSMQRSPVEPWPAAAMWCCGTRSASSAWPKGKPTKLKTFNSGRTSKRNHVFRNSFSKMKCYEEGSTIGKSLNMLFSAWKYLLSFHFCQDPLQTSRLYQAIGRLRIPDPHWQGQSEAIRSCVKVHSVLHNGEIKICQDCSDIAEPIDNDCWLAVSGRWCFEFCVFSIFLIALQAFYFASCLGKQRAAGLPCL